MEIDPRLFFIVVVPDGDPTLATPMQGFAPSICQNAWMLRGVVNSPSTIFDLTEDGQKTLIFRRMAGLSPVNWHPQSPRAIRSIEVPPSCPFTFILLPDSECPSEYDEWLSKCRIRPRIVSSKGGDLTFSDLTFEGLQKALIGICVELRGLIGVEKTELFKNAIQGWRTVSGRDLGYKVRGHNSVTPNLAALASAGFRDMVDGPFVELGSSIQPYVDQIAATAHTILDERDAIGELYLNRVFRQTLDLNLFAPSIYPDFFDWHVDFGDEQERRRFVLTRQALEKQSGYGFQMNTVAQREALFGGVREGKPQPHPLLLIRQQELSVATECVAGLAASEFSAVLRLPNDINRTRGAVRNFASHYRSDSPNSRKRLQSFRSVQERIKAAVPDKFIEIVRKSRTGIRIISDAHLEWLDIDGLPLGIRYNVTRVPVTPGNLFVGNIASHDRIVLHPDDFCNVLVISALDRQDPISGMFDLAFGVFENEWKDRLSVQFVEVSCEGELIAALDGFSGNLVVFDGHGRHAKDEPANLYLKGRPIDVWSLRGRLKRVPPVFILSACETHAADRNHATTANGLLAIGARSVLASVFPIDARDAAVFTARLMYRVSTYIKAAIGTFGRALTWSEIVSGMLRMQLLTDYLRLLQKKNIINEAQYMDVHMKGNLAINGGADDPFSAVNEQLVEFGVDPRVLPYELALAVANSSVISYLHMGRPETVLIDDPDRRQSLIPTSPTAQ